MGPANLKNLESENIVALCDVDPKNAARTIQRYPSAKFYTDYRDLLDHQKDLDGLVIATPDHTHAVITMAAMRAGKHVYCQKPLTHDVYEARMLTKAARESKVQTQMGIQGHSGEGIRQTCEWIWSGQLGEVRASRCLVQPLVLPLGPCLVELQVVRASQGGDAHAVGPQLG